MNNINNHQSQDPTTRLLSELFSATIFVSFFIWAAWMHFYFHVGLGKSIILVINNNTPLIRPFLMMCFLASFFVNAFLFTYFSRTTKKDKHHRGAKRED